MPPSQGKGDLSASGPRLMLRHLMVTGWTNDAISAGTGLSTLRIRHIRRPTAKTVTRTEAALIWRFYVDHYENPDPSPYAAGRARSLGYLPMWRVAPKLVPQAYLPDPALSSLSIHLHEVQVRRWLVFIRQTPFWDILTRSLDYYLTHRFELVMSDAEAFIRAFKFRSTIPLLTNSAFSSVTGMTEPRIRWLTTTSLLALLSQPGIPINGHADDLSRYLITLAAS